jgi:hypothetical protein
MWRSVKKMKQQNGRVTSAYKVQEWNQLSDDPAANIRRIEKERGAEEVSVRGRFFQEEEIAGNEWNPVDAQPFD